MTNPHFNSKHLFSLMLISMLLLSCSARQEIIAVVNETGNRHLRFEANTIDQFIVNQGYVVAFNQEKKVPDYTIHHLTPEQLQEKNGYKAHHGSYVRVDKRIATHSARPSDYHKSGYDRGHYVPAGDFVHSQELKDETQIYSNVSPQLKELNRSKWRHVEIAIRKEVLRCDCAAYIVTGSIFQEGHKTIGENQIGVPDQLYKIAFFDDCKKMYAFRMNNSREAYSGNIRDYQLTVNELEKLVHQDFFENLPDDKENLLESKIQYINY